jgi:hypothetical protein
MAAETIITGKRRGISNWFTQLTVFVDIEKKLFKIQESFLGIFKWGEFKSLPKIDYVLLFRNYYAKCEQCSLDEESDLAYYQVSLIHSGKRRIIVHESRKYNEAREIAEKLAQNLNLKISDRFSTRLAS